jgi:hypothetical protein
VQLGYSPSGNPDAHLDLRARCARPTIAASAMVATLPSHDFIPAEPRIRGERRATTTATSIPAALANNAMGPPTDW